MLQNRKKCYKTNRSIWSSELKKRFLKQKDASSDNLIEREDRFSLIIFLTDSANNNSSLASLDLFA